MADVYQIILEQILEDGNENEKQLAQDIYDKSLELAQLQTHIYSDLKEGDNTRQAHLHSNQALFYSLRAIMNVIERRKSALAAASKTS